MRSSGEYWWSTPTENVYSVLHAYRKHNSLRRDFTALVTDWPVIDDFVARVIEWVTDGIHKGDRPILMHALRDALRDYRHARHLNDRERISVFVKSLIDKVASDLSCLRIVDGNRQWWPEAQPSVREWFEAAGLEDRDISIHEIDPDENVQSMLHHKLMNYSLRSPLRERVKTLTLVEP